MAGPRTTREALIAEVLGDLDGLISRVEALPSLVASSEEKITATAKIIEDAGAKYRLAVLEFTEQAKGELSNHLENSTRKAEKITLDSFEKQKAAFQKVAKESLESGAIYEAVKRIKTESKKETFEKLFTNFFIAFSSSIFTTTIFYFILKNGYL
jgi:hypothetical protein